MDRQRGLRKKNKSESILNASDPPDVGGVKPCASYPPGQVEDWPSGYIELVQSIDALRGGNR